MLSGDDTFDAPGVPALPLLGTERRRRVERRGDALRTRVRLRGRERLRRPDAGRPACRRTSWRSRRRSRRARRPTARKSRPPTSASRRRRLGHPGRAAVGARVLEPQRREGVPVHPRRGHRVRQDHPERRLLRGHGRAAGDPGRPRAGSARGPFRHARRVHERADLQAACWIRTTRSVVDAVGALERGRRRLQQPGVDPPTRQRRDDGDRSADHRGPGQRTTRER